MRSEPTLRRSTLRRSLRRCAAAGARGHGGAIPVLQRGAGLHAHGEELAVFPALEEVALWSRRHTSKTTGAWISRRHPGAAVSVRDALQTARATAAFKFHLDIHLAKEDTHLYRIIRERVSVPDQGKAVGVMAGTVPADRNPDLIAWMFPLLGDDDRENMTRVWQMVMPPEVFAGAMQVVHQAIGDDFEELNRRIPELAT
jgi:hypothetical protein